MLMVVMLIMTEMPMMLMMLMMLIMEMEMMQRVGDAITTKTTTDPNAVLLPVQMLSCQMSCCTSEANSTFLRMAIYLCNNRIGADYSRRKDEFVGAVDGVVCTWLSCGGCMRCFFKIAATSNVQWEEVFWTV
mmetsp:Transcript_6485/g.14090  ORF Transcript_6485/g.14090 Transcript_6485/m.14090 type:complete len:132 (-) Transcript_6485:327-722(-)